MAAVIGVTVRGLAPGMLMSSPAAMLIPPDPDNKPGPRAKAESREVIAERLAYRMSDGSLGFPSAAFQRAGMEGGKGQSIKVEGKGRAVSIQGVLAGLWEVEPKGLIPLTRDGKPIMKYATDIRTGLNRNARPVPARIVLVRPLVEAPWDADFDILWDDVGGSASTPDLIRSCLERAGRQVGVGAFRPLVQGKATGGWFGRFEVVKWEAA